MINRWFFISRLVSKELKDNYIEYVLLYDTIANRITIDEVQAEHGSLRLMKNVWWEYDKLPHMLIAGGTGGMRSVSRRYGLACVGVDCHTNHLSPLSNKGVQIIWKQFNKYGKSR